MDGNPLLVTIILAAGESKRMGEPKLFLEVRGDSMLRNAVFGALSKPIIVVTGAYHEETKQHLRDIEEVVLAYNPNWRDGMSSSIAIGVLAAKKHNPQGYLIMLADQPDISAENLGFFADKFYRDPNKIVATQYPERFGVPAIFPVRYTDQLLDGKGPNGARKLIAAAGEQVEVFKFASPPIDIDTPEDYQRYLKGFQ